MKKKIAVVVPPVPSQPWRFEATSTYCWGAHELDAQGRLTTLGGWCKTRREAKEYGHAQFRRYCIARVETLK